MMNSNLKFQGRLEDIAFLEVMGMIADYGASGHLNMRTEAFEANIWFKKGRTIFADTNSPEDSISGILIKLGKKGNDSEELEGGPDKISLEKRIKHNFDLSRKLIKQNVLTAKELINVQRCRTLQIIYRLAVQKEGDVYFLPCDPNDAGFISINMDSFDVILEIVRYGLPEEYLTEFFKKDTVIAEIKKEKQSRFKELNLTQGELLVYHLINGKRDIGKLVSISPLGRLNTLKIIISMFFLGIIRIKES